MGQDKRKAALMLVLVLALCTVLQSTALAAALRVGSRGEEVRQLQTKLKRWGYYSGAVDGIFGPMTREAVRSYQAQRGLTADGIAGPMTWAALDKETEE